MRRHATIAALALGLATATSVAAQEAGGAPDPASRKVLDLTGKVLGLQGQGSTTSGASSPLERAAADLTAANSAITVRRDGDSIRVAVKGDVLFDFDRAEIRADATPTLAALAEVLARNGGDRIVVEGHTDSKGAPAYNQALSERRAQATIEWLTVRKQIAVERLSLRGLGASQPVAPNAKPDGSDDPAGRAKNRRVEFVVPNASSR